MTKATNGKKQIKGILILLFASFIWGSSFVAQSEGMENVDALTFTAVRSFMGCMVLLPVILIKDLVTGRRLSAEAKTERKGETKRSITYGLILGVLLCLASNLQQFAFYYSSSGKIAFITAVYMFFVPIIGLFLGKRLPFLTWASVAFGFWGLFLLCIDPKELGSVNMGDLLSLGCAFVYAIHILLVERFVPKADGLKISCTQLAVSGSISFVLMFIFENPSLGDIRLAIVPLLYSGVMSCGVAYTLQLIGQKYAEATAATLAMSMESVFAVLCSAVLLAERMHPREIIGCCIMFVAIVLSQTADQISEHFKRITRHN